MAQRLATWTVTATVAEPVELLAAFACHHLKMGASEVRLYLDKPIGQAKRELRRIPGVVVIPCNKNYWASEWNIEAPERLMLRQRRNALHAYRETKADWLANIDADEFLFSREAIDQVLAEVPDDDDFVIMPNVERVFRRNDMSTIFSGLFRVRSPHRQRRNNIIFGDVNTYTRSGFSGYVIGKSFLRTGRRMVPGLHRPFRRDGDDGLSSDLKSSEIAMPMVCHFDGLTPLHWIAKLLRYHEMGTYSGKMRQDPARVAQIEYVMKNLGSVAAVQELHDLVKTIDAETEKRLTEMGLLIDPGLDPSNDVADLAPWLSFDYDVQKFDRSLRASRPTLAEQLVDYDRYRVA